MNKAGSQSQSSGHVLLVLLFTVFTSLSAKATHFTAEWLSTTNLFADWTNAANWSIGQVPGNRNGDTYDVVIVEPAHFLQVNLETDMTVNKLTLANDLHTGGFPRSGLNFHVNDTFHWQGGTLSGNAAKYHLHGDAYFEGTSAKTLYAICELYLYGNTHWTGGSLNLGSYGKTVLQPGAQFSMETGGSIGGADFYNNGLVTCMAAGEPVYFANYFHNSGQLDVVSGNFRLLNKFDTGGIINVYSNATLAFQCWTMPLTNLTLHNEGLMEFLPNNPIDLPGDFTFPGHTRLSGTVRSNGNITLGHAEWSDVTILAAQGTITVPQDGSLIAQSVNVAQRPLQNLGYLQVSTNAFLVTASNAWNAPDAVIELQQNGHVGASVNNTTGGSDGIRTILNEGLIKAAANNGVSSYIDGYVRNLGNIQIEDGTLTINGCYDGGSISIPESATLNFDGDGELVYSNNATWTGSGNVIISEAGKSWLIGQIDPRLKFTFDSDVVLARYPGYTFPSLNFLRGSLSSSNVNQVLNSLTLNNSTVKGSAQFVSQGNLTIGSVTNASKAQFRIEETAGFQNMGTGTLAQCDIIPIGTNSWFLNSGSLTFLTNGAFFIPAGRFTNAGQLLVDPSLKGFSLIANSRQCALRAVSTNYLGTNGNWHLAGPASFATNYIEFRSGADLFCSDLQFTNLPLTIRAGAVCSSENIGITNCTITLDGYLSSLGAFNFSGGTLQGSGTLAGNTVSAGGLKINPATAGETLIVNGNLNLFSNSVLVARLDGKNSGMTNSMLVVSNSLSVAGTFDINLAADALDYDGKIITLAQAGLPITGIFSNAPSGSLITNSLTRFRIWYGTNSPYSPEKIVLSEIDTPFSLWQRSTFTATELNNPEISGTLADPDGNGFANVAEFALGIQHGVTGNASYLQVAPIASPKGFEIKFTRLQTPGAVKIEPSFSVNLTNWISTPNPFGPLIQKSITNTNGLSTFTYNFVTTQEKVFIKVKVTPP